MRRAVWVLLFPWLIFPGAFAQTDNTVYVKHFLQPNWTVGMATTAAQNACSAGMKCIVVFDPSLVLYPTGTMPAACANCVWTDYRYGSPFVNTSGGLVTGQLGGEITNPAALPFTYTGYGYTSAARPWNLIWQGASHLVTSYDLVQGVNSTEGGDYGNPSYGPNGWSGVYPHAENFTNEGAGQMIDDYDSFTQAGVGDFALRYSTVNWYLGVQAPSDEGFHLRALNGLEAASTFAGSFVSASGNNFTIDCTTDCGHQGQLRYLLDLTHPIASGTETAHAASSGETPEEYTVTISSGTLTPSTAWGTLAANCGPTSSQWNVGSQTVNVSCPVNVTSGTFATGSHDSFSGQFHETALDANATALSGGQQTLTLNTRAAHESGSWVMEGGVSGSCIVFSDDISDGLKYPLTVLGAPDSSHIYVRPFAYGATPGGFSSYVGNLAASGATGAFTIYPCWQVTDVQGGSGVPPLQTAGNTVLTVEPGAFTPSANDSMEEEHDAGYSAMIDVLRPTLHNPCVVTGDYLCQWGAYAAKLSGSGFYGLGFGNQNSYSLDNAAFYAENDASYTLYANRAAPDVLRIYGPFDGIIESRYAPRHGAYYFGCPYEGCTSTTPWTLYELVGNSGNSGLEFTADTNTFTDISPTFDVWQYGSLWQYHSGAYYQALDTYSAPQPLKGTSGSIGGSALAAGACTTGTVTISGASTSMVPDVAPVTFPGSYFRWAGYVSSSGVVTVEVCNFTSSSETPTASDYNVRVLQ